MSNALTVMIGLLPLVVDGNTEPLGPHFICETKLPSPASPLWTTTIWHRKPPIITEHVPKSLSSMNFKCLIITSLCGSLSSYFSLQDTCCSLIVHYKLWNSHLQHPTGVMKLVREATGKASLLNVPSPLGAINLRSEGHNYDVMEGRLRDP